jgi:glycosyltransferase involved in cell wall biosynthesis
MPRLLILCEYPTLLGGERSMLATLPAIVAAGFDVQIAAPGSGPLPAARSPIADALTELGVAHVRWSVHDDRGVRLPLARLRSEVANLISKLRPDLVHANSLSMARVAGPVTAEFGVPGLGHLRDIVNLSRQAVSDVNTNRRLAAVSHATREFHVARGIDAAKCVVLHNGVDLDAFQPQQPSGYLHQELNLPPQAQLVATIGQLGARKGTSTVLCAARCIVGECPNVHWLIVGERTSEKQEAHDYESRLVAAARQAPLDGRVHFLGWRHDVPKLLNECMLVVHAAEQEPLGRVLLEAAASGVAVVATDVGGTREIFPNERDGAVIVPPGDDAALATAMLELLRDQVRRQTIAANGRRRAELAFDIHVAAQRMIEQYRELLIP